jgi:hypothetical protein
MMETMGSLEISNKSFEVTRTIVLTCYFFLLLNKKNVFGIKVFIHSLKKCYVRILK